MPDPINPIIGHTAGWGLFTPRLPIRPYTLTAGATDTMRVRVREKIDIHGVGTDVIQMEGTFTVRRDHPRSISESTELKWGQALIKTEFRSLELYGESQLFGTVHVRLDPTHVSHGEVGLADRESLAAACKASMHPVIELPQLGLKLGTDGQAVQLGSKVIQIPPVGDVARSENSVSLKDESNRVVGEIISSDIEVGDILHSIPLGNIERF